MDKLRKKAAAAKEGGASSDPFDAIHSKARWNKLDECKELVDKGCPVDRKNEHGNTPLHMACQNGHAEVAAYFVSMKCNVNEKNGKGNTALHFCSAYNYPEIAEMLKKAGADTSLKNDDGKLTHEGIE